MTDDDARFCAGCGAALRPPTTVDLDTPASAPPVPPPAPPPAIPHPPPAIPHLPPAIPHPPPPVSPPPVPVPPVAPPPEPEPALAAPIDVVAVDNRPAAFAALVGAVLGVVGAFQVWLRITVASTNPPGSAETGWKGGDGRTIVVAAVVAAIAGVGLLLRRRELWLKVALLIAGGVTLVIALVHMANVSSKASDIEVRFGIPTGDVHAEVGAGLYVVAASGVALLSAGLRARTSS